MWQLNNTSPFAATAALFPNEDAVDTLYVIVKATFTIGKKITLAGAQSKPFEADVYWAEPGQSSVKHASDMHIGKAATDIIMLGHACAPAQKAVNQLDVSLAVGAVSKTVRVFGERQWHEGRITAPAAFKTMAMVYEKAYGGVHIVNGKMDSAETRNPVGRGFAGSRKIEEMNGVPLPNLENPQALIRAHTDNPAPVCFGFCAPNWHPRAAWAGTYDDHWKKTRAPFLPQDFDKRFLNMAHADLVYPGFLAGGEAVHISNMNPHGAIQFDVPRVKLATRIAVADKTEQPAFDLETLILEPNAMTVSMVWRAALPCDKKHFKLGEIKIALTR